MATVSHELRTPLNSILGWARLMNSGSLDPRQTAKAVRTIIKNSESQNRLIEDLLDVARMISGKLELDISDVPVYEIIANSVETAKPAASEHDVAIEVHMENGGGDKTVAGDRVRLEQIVGNLLANAVKFTPRGGRIDVSAAAVGDDVEIVVSDNGKGISAEFLPMVFERFRQDQTSGKSAGGLGLGLAVVRNLTELHGGTVSAFSEGENRGSTFKVRLPASVDHGRSLSRARI
jgi:signal transduction histidine kinase